MRRGYRLAAGMQLLLGVAILLVETACFGPITATTALTKAEAAIERARIADAHEKAPHEYYTAENYLLKAKEEWSYSDFQASDQYATEARRAADRALTKAKEDPWGGSPVPESKRNKARLETDRDPNAEANRQKETPEEILEGVEDKEQ